MPIERAAVMAARWTDTTTIMEMTMTDKERDNITGRWWNLRNEIPLSERTVMSSALRLSAEQYLRDAAANSGRIRDQFQFQADVCTAIADGVEP